MAKAILVVEDETQVRTVINAILADAGFTIVEAKDGTVGLNELRKRRGRFAAVVTDIDMGRMNGLELAEAVKTRFPDLPILFVSALPVMPDDLEAIAPGSGFLKKPFDATTLVAAVNGLIDRK